jgi:hypothetical protein
MQVGVGFVLELSFNNNDIELLHTTFDPGWVGGNDGRLNELKLTGKVGQWSKPACAL